MFFSRRTPDELVAAIKGLTDLAAEDVKKRHIGHWLGVTGPVVNIASTSPGTTLVYVNPEGLTADLMLQFKEAIWRHRLAAYDVGDYISAIGSISDFDAWMGGSVTLVDCRLVDQLPAKRPKGDNPA